MRRSWVALPWAAAALVAAFTVHSEPTALAASEKGPHRIALSRIGPVRTGLFIADADGLNERPLIPAEGLDYNASFSSDGRWIVFTSERMGSADIYRVHPDGSGMERLTSDLAYEDQAALSPDGSTLAFVSTRDDGMANIWLLDLATHRIRNLTKQPGSFRPSWSPNGKWIAFTSDRDTHPGRAAGRWEFLQATDLYITRVDGTGLRRLQTRGFAGSPKWSSDGRQIVYYESVVDQTFAVRARSAENSVSQIATVDVASGARTALTTLPGIKLSPQWLGAHRIGYVTKWGPNPGLEFTSGEPGARGQFRNPAWSSDGKQVVYHKDLPAERHRMTPTFSRDPQFELMLAEFFAAYSPSGDRVVVSARSPEPVAGDFEESSLQIMNTGGSERRTIFSLKGNNALAPSWSPHDDQIVFGLGTFFFRPGPPAQLALIKPDGSGFRTITNGEGDKGFPSWSPDGKRLVYRADSGRGRGLVILSLADGQITSLTTGPQYDNFPAWSPRGDRIAFTSNRDGGDFNIYTVKVDGSNVRRLTDSHGNDSHSAWSPDGEWILFSSSRKGYKDEAPLSYRIPQPYGELFVMRSDGFDVRQLTDNQWEDGLPAWMPEKVSGNDRDRQPEK